MIRLVVAVLLLLAAAAGAGAPGKPLTPFTVLLAFLPYGE